MADEQEPTDKQQSSDEQTPVEDSSLPDFSEPIPKRSDITKIVRNVAYRHLAHEGIMLARMQRNLRQSERMQKFAATNDMNDLYPEDDNESNDMAVNIGNETHHHNYINYGDKPQSESVPVAAPVPTVPTVPSPAAQPTVPVSGSSPSPVETIASKVPSLLAAYLAPLALTSVSLAGGFIAAKLFDKQQNVIPPAVTQPNTDTDTDTVNVLDFPSHVLSGQSDTDIED